MMSSYQNMVNEFEDGIDTFVTTPETRQIAQPKEHKYKCKGVAPNCEIGLPLNSLFL